MTSTDGANAAVSTRKCPSPVGVTCFIIIVFTENLLATGTAAYSYHTRSQRRSDAPVTDFIMAH